MSRLRSVDMEGKAEISQRRRFDHGQPYFTQLSREWSEGVRKVFKGLPALEW